MGEPNILVATDARGVATVALNRPHVRNAFDEHLIAAELEVGDLAVHGELAYPPDEVMGGPPASSPVPA